MHGFVVNKHNPKTHTHARIRKIVNAVLVVIVVVIAFPQCHFAAENQQ